MRKILLALLLARLAHADPLTGQLKGRVVDPAGVPVGGAVVSAEGGEVSRSVRSTADGSFSIEELLPGPYRIEAVAEGRAPGTASASVGPGEEASVSLSVGAAPRAPAAVGSTGGTLLAGLPLWSRSAPAVLRLSLAARARAGSHPRFPAAQGNPEWQLDGFEFTHPITGGPALPVGLESLVAGGVEEVGPGVWGTGPLAGLVLRSGSNKYDVAAVAVGRPVEQGTVEADTEGAVWKDRLWYALSGQAQAGGEGGSSGRMLSKVTMQLSARHKLTLLGVLTGGQAPSTEARFGGLRWEALASDNVVLSLHLSVLEDRTRGLPHTQLGTGQGRVDWYPSTRGMGEHWLSLSASGSRVDVAGVIGTRGHLRLEDQWRPTRYLTVAGAVAVTRARLPDRAGLDGGPAGLLSLAWDATHDGRAAVRARASTATVPGLVAVACADCAGSTRVAEAAVGIERELRLDVAGGLEVLARRAQAGGAEREALVALHLTHRRRAYKLHALYQGRLLPSPGSELLALASLGLTRRLSAGALVIYAPRSTWLPLFEPPPGPLTPAAGGSGWLLGLQLRAEVGDLLGLPAALWLDALNLTNDRGTLATAGLTPIRTPPFQLRVGLRVQY